MSLHQTLEEHALRNVITHGEDLYVWWSKEGGECTRVNFEFCKTAQRAEIQVTGEWEEVGCSGTWARARFELRFAPSLLLAM